MNMGEEYGPTGKTGVGIEDSPFFKPPETIRLGGLLAFVPRGLTKEQYREWYRRMEVANQAIVDSRGKLKVANGEVKIDVPVRKEGMGIKVNGWIRNAIDGMCCFVCGFWYKGKIMKKK